MPPPIPLSGAAAWYWAGSQSGSASSSANRGRRASQACSGDDAEAIDLPDVVDKRSHDGRVEDVLVTHGRHSDPVSTARRRE